MENCYGVSWKLLYVSRKPDRHNCFRPHLGTIANLRAAQSDRHWPVTIYGGTRGSAQRGWTPPARIPGRQTAKKCPDGKHDGVLEDARMKTSQELQPGGRQSKGALGAWALVGGEGLHQPGCCNLSNIVSGGVRNASVAMRHSGRVFVCRVTMFLLMAITRFVVGAPDDAAGGCRRRNTDA